MVRSPTRLLWLLLAACSLPLEMAFAATTSSAPATGKVDAGEPVVSLEIVAGEQPGQLAVMRGRDCRQQLIVTGRTAEGRLIDLTDDAAYTAQPAGIVELDDLGLVRPLTDGQVAIEARLGKGLTARVGVEVKNCRKDVAVNFPNEIVPVFTKFGCNSGGCHGKSGGQNGFRLSLLGFEPTEDYEHLVKEGRGRRLFPGSPDESLLLKKATNSVPHGGGQRLAARRARIPAPAAVDRSGHALRHATRSHAWIASACIRWSGRCSVIRISRCECSPITPTARCRT